MRYKQLGDICNYVLDKVACGETSIDYYISTANMLKDRKGIQQASSIPLSGNVTKFQKGDVLVSNIRPYFKKIWKAEFNGTCSNDVLVFRASNVNSDYLFYLLSCDSFFDYMMSTAKGTKMPRGDKKAILQYLVDIPSEKEQILIANKLAAIDRKISINCQVNDNLQQQAFLYFNKLIQSPGDKCMVLSEYAYINPPRQLKKGTKAKCIEMSNLSTSGAFPSVFSYKEYKGGMKFCNGDTLFARITPCLENGKTAYVSFLDKDEIAFGSTEYIILSPKDNTPSQFLYCLSRFPNFVDYAVKNMNGSSGRQRVSAEIISNYLLPSISETAFHEFDMITSVLFEKMLINHKENLILQEMRDALLVKLFKKV